MTEPHPNPEHFDKLSAGSFEGQTPEARPEPVEGQEPAPRPESVEGQSPEARPEPVEGQTPGTRPEPVEGQEPAPRRTNRGAGRALIAVYGLFAIAATSRAVVQIVTDFGEAPLAFLLSAFAALVYLVATFTLGRGTPRSRRVALVAVTIELVGVLTVGTLSLLDPAAFPRATVWSVYGIGYGFVPFVLPILGLLWLYRTRPGRPA